MRQLSFVLFALLLAGCQVFGPDTNGLELETDARSYTMRDDGVTISLDVRNGLSRAVYYICTGQVYLEEWENGEMAASWQVHGFEECLSAEPIEQAETFTFALSTEIFSLIFTAPPPRFNDTVNYQLRVDLFYDTMFRQQLTDELSRSNSFKIVQE